MSLSNVYQLSDLTEQQQERYEIDQAFRNEVDLAIINNDNKRRAAKLGASDSSPPSGGEKGGASKSGGPPQQSRPGGVSRIGPISSAKYGSVDPATLREAMLGGTAEKVREMTPAELEVKFSDLCDHMGIEEEKMPRMMFYYSVIAWITLNTASTENAIDSVLHGDKSSLTMLEFFAHDIRPFARAMAFDAKQFIAMVCADRTHPMFEAFTSLSRKYNVPKTPWLIYDGIDAMGLTGGESRIAAHIKQQRLSTNVNYNVDATVNRNLLSGNDFMSRPEN